MQLCSFIEAFFKSLIAVCVSSTVAVKNRIVAFKSHITARRHLLTNRRATRNFRFRRPVAMILSLVMALQFLMVFTSATSGTTSKPDPWAEGSRKLWYYDEMIDGGEELPKGHVTINSKREIELEVEEGASLMGRIIPAGKYDLVALAKKYAATLWLTPENACLSMSLTKGDTFWDDSMPVYKDGVKTSVTLDGGYLRADKQQIEALDLPVAVVTTAGYMNLRFVVESAKRGAFVTMEYLEDTWDAYYDVRFQTAIEKVAVNNLSADLPGVWLENKGGKLIPHTSMEFCSYYWDTETVPDDVRVYVDFIRHEDTTDVQDYAIWFSDNGEEPVSVRHNGLIAWADVNPRQCFLFRGTRATVTYISATLLLRMAGGYTEKQYIRNPDGPDVAEYKLVNGQTVRFFMGTHYCEVDGTPRDLGEEIFVLNGTTLVPIRASEGFGLKITWSGRNASGMGTVLAENTTRHTYG